MTRPAAIPMMMMPATAARLYASLTPRNGTDMISPVQKMMLSTTAEPMPAIASANPASGPLTPDNVSSRYPRAELAALPPGTMFDSAFVLSWIRNMRAIESWRPAVPSVARVNNE